MICPVCRSQNLETAKFCGNCGSPFPRSNTPPSSSLLNCTQGHVYSAVYEHCPYCPQPDRPASSDFATRIESPETEVDTPPPSTPPPASARTEKMRRDYATLIESEAGLPTFTDPITGSPTAETFVDPGGPTQPPFNYSTQPPSRPSSPSLRTNPVPEAPTVVPPPPPPPEAPKTPIPPPTPMRTPAAAPVAEAAKQRMDRRTLVVPSEEMPAVVVSKGKLVGWLVAFGVNTDGTDYRLHAGRNVIGASPSCDITTDDEAVSGVHASIVYRNGRCLIKDELSSNGTFVNGTEIQEPCPLQNYDEVRVGNTTLTFVSVERLA